MAAQPEVKVNFQAYLDDEASPAERLAVEQACAGSPEHRAELRAWQAQSNALFGAMRPYRLARSLRQPVLDNLPEMDRRLIELEQVNWRAKHPGSRWHWAARWLPAVAAIMIVTLGLALRYNWPEVQPVDSAIGVVVQAEGSPLVIAGSDLAQTTAAPSEYIRPGDVYETNGHETLMLQLVGDSSVRMQGDTRLRVEGERDVRLERGKAFFDVGPAGKLFRVYTRGAEVTVFGTAFEVAVHDQEVAVAVARGEVTVENDRGWRFLRAGQSVSVRRGEEPAPPATEDVSARLAWVNTIQPDPAASMLYHAQLAEAFPVGSIGAVVVHMVDTTAYFEGRPPQLEGIRLRWERSAAPMADMCSYEVYVNDALNNALFKYRIDERVFERSDASEYTIPIPASVERMPRVFNVRVVPRCDTSTEPHLAFQVSAVPRVR